MKRTTKIMNMVLKMVKDRKFVKYFTPLVIKEENRVKYGFTLLQFAL